MNNSTHSKNTSATETPSSQWKRALYYAGATVAGPVLAYAIAPAAAVVIAPFVVALPFFTMAALEADVAHHQHAA